MTSTEDRSWTISNEVARACLGEPGYERVDGFGVVDVSEELTGAPAFHGPPISMIFGLFDRRAPALLQSPDGDSIPSAEGGDPEVGDC